MLVFGSYKDQRLAIKVDTGLTVKELKDKIKLLLGIAGDFYRQDKKVLALIYAGADLQDSWVFSDLGILPGSNIKIKLKEEVKPVLYIECSHNMETVSVYEDISITHMKLEQIRNIASLKTGLPVGIFRLTTRDGREMFDVNRLDDYGVDIGHTILLENWDGWNEFLNLAIMGFTPQVISQIQGDEAVARYQMKVALFIASHYGHVDLARYLLKLGCRSDEPTGYHPSRAWCQNQGHKDSFKCPVHEATLCGQLAVLKLFVYHDITCLKAKDGDGLEPINLALRKKIKNCAAFLVSKQWAKINLTKTFTVRLGTYATLKAWCNRAKERALVKYGASKSSLKRRAFIGGALVHHGTLVDGFSKSPMNGKARALLQREEARSIRRRQEDMSSQDPESYFRALITLQGMKKPSRGHVRFPARWSRPLIADSTATLDSTSEHGSDSKNNLTKQNATITFAEVNTQKPKIIKSNVSKLPPIVQPIQSGELHDPNSEVGPATPQKGKLTLMKNSKGAYFQTRSQDNLNAPTDRGDKQTLIKSRVTSESDDDKLAKSLTAQSLTSGMSMNDDVISEEESKASTTRSKKRKSRLSDAWLLSKAKSNEGGIPLPLVSHEQSRRPFFYHQGQREDELVESTLSLVAKYKGDTSRDRAIKSLTLAKTFTGKPWLGQVRVALNLTNNSFRRGLPVIPTKTNLAAN